MLCFICLPLSRVVAIVVFTSGTVAVSHVILQRHARRLLSAGRLFDLGTFAAQLDFHMVSWLKKESHRYALSTDFIQRGLASNFQLNVLFYAYFACHGCSDSRQYILLNERKVEKIFWPAEERIK